MPLRFLFHHLNFSYNTQNELHLLLLFDKNGNNIKDYMCIFCFIHFVFHIFGNPPAGFFLLFTILFMFFVCTFHIHTAKIINNLVEEMD